MVTLRPLAGLRDCPERGRRRRGPLSSVVQGVNEVVDSFNDLGEGTKSALLGSVVALPLWLVRRRNRQGGDIRQRSQGRSRELGVTAKGAAIAIGAVGAVIGIAALGFASYAANAAESQARVDDFTTALQGQNDAIQQNVTNVAAKQLQDAGAVRRLTSSVWTWVL